MSKTLSKFQKMRADAHALWDESIFRSEREPSRLYKFLHFWVLVWRSFVRNRCPIRAAALSYATLLALIPMLALAMSVTTSLLKKEGADQIERFIEEMVDRIVPPAPVTTYPDTPENLPSIVDTNVFAELAASTNTPDPDAMLAAAR
jgi:hypothetical protein